MRRFISKKLGSAALFRLRCSMFLFKCIKFQSSQRRVNRLGSFFFFHFSRIYKVRKVSTILTVLGSGNGVEANFMCWAMLSYTERGSMVIA